MTNMNTTLIISQSGKSYSYKKAKQEIEKIILE